MSYRVSEYIGFSCSRQSGEPNVGSGYTTMAAAIALAVGFDASEKWACDARHLERKDMTDALSCQMPSY